MFRINSNRSPYIIAAILALVVGAVSLSFATTSADGSMDEAQRNAFFAMVESDVTESGSPEAVLGGMVPCSGGSASGYPCSNVDLLAFMPLNTVGGGLANDIWGWEGCGGREFAILGRNNGTSFVDISNPAAPIYLGNLATHTSTSTWRDIKTYDDHAFIVSEANGHGMQVFDLNRLCNVASPPATFNNDAHYNGFGNAHNIVINEASGFAYGVGTSTCSGGLHMVDITTPTSPTNAGCFSSDGYTHDAQCVIYNGPDATHVGKEICFAYNEDTVTIVDVTNKAAPVQLERQGYAGSSYTHQGWLTEDHQYIVMDDELDEQNSGHNTRTRIFDATDLDNITLIGQFDSAIASIDHNMYVHNGCIYQSNYSGGLRILGTTDIANGNLFEAAYFDTYPSTNSASFNGTWSNYPYYDSGVVVVSGRGEGLFIVEPTNTSICTAAPTAVSMADSTASSATGLTPVVWAVALALSVITLGGAWIARRQQVS